MAKQNDSGNKGGSSKGSGNGQGKLVRLSEQVRKGAQSNKAVTRPPKRGDK